MPRNTRAKATQNQGTLRIRDTGWRRECDRFNIAGDTQIAAHLGLPMPTYYRVRTHYHEPSTKFIKAALAAFPGARFEDLFEVTEQVAA
jgi:hypothetical protein